MRCVLASVITIALTSAYSMSAQTMVEYSNLATKSPASQKALSTKLNSALEKPMAQAGVQPSVSQPKKAETDAQSAPKPTPPAVFILGNGERLESLRYVLTASTLKIEQNGTERVIPISALNVKATEAANQERGLNVKIPKDSGQMTLSF